MNNALNSIDEKYLHEFYSLPESEIKTRAFYSLMKESSLGHIPTDVANYLEVNLLSESKDPFILDLLKPLHLEYNDNKSSKGEAGINIKKGWSL